MLNKPIPYSFDYSLSRENKSFKSGIEIKPYPYKFKHVVGLSHGSYRFRYDRRNELHIENNESSYVIFPSDINFEDGEASYVSVKSDVDIYNAKTLSSFNYEEIMLNKYISLQRTLKEQILLDKEYLISSIIRKLKKDKGKYLSPNISFIDKSKEVTLDDMDKNIVKDNEYIFEANIDKNISRERDYKFDGVENNFIERNLEDEYILTIPEKPIDKEKEFILDIFDHLFLKEGESLLNNQDDYIIKNSEYELESTLKHMNLNDKDYNLLVDRHKDIFKEHCFSLFKDIDKRNLSKETLERVLFRTFSKDDLMKGDKENILYSENIGDVIKGKNNILHKESLSYEVDIYEESLWGRMYSEMIKEVMATEGLTLFKDRDIHLNGQGTFLKSIRNINIYKDLDESDLELIRDSMLDKESKLYLLSSRLSELERKSKDKSFIKLPIASIDAFINNIELENITTTDITLENSFKELVKETTKDILKDITVKHLDSTTIKNLEKSLGSIAFDIERTKNIDKENGNKKLSNNNIKDVNRYALELNLGTKRIKDMNIDSCKGRLDVERLKEIQIDNKEIELIVSRVLLIEKNIKEFILDILMDNELEIDNFEATLSKSAIRDIDIKTSDKPLSKSENELEVNKFDYYYRKAIDIIEKNKEHLADKTFKVIIEDLFEVVMESVEKEISTNMELQLEKSIIKKMIKNKLEILIRKVTSKYLEKDINDIRLDKTVKAEVELDVREFLLDKIKADAGMLLDSEEHEVDKELYKEIIDDLVKGSYLLELVSDVLISINKDIRLDVSTKDILTHIFKELEKQNKQIMINEDLPLVKVYREINKTKPDIQVLREHSIVKEKSVELAQEFRVIDKFKDRNLDLYKRFWFLRATDPLDWKIVPYNNFPYEDDPVVFDENKEMIPDNWQLEMVDVENKLFKKIDKNPIPFGEGTSNVEMALSIEIMIEMINILILLWSRLFYAFTGYTGTQSVTRLTRTLYEWLTLETSINAMGKKESKKHYMRAYRWIRWEAEKVAIEAREDMSLNGNFYIDEFIFELIYYMENHHFDTMPLFEAINVMDEYRALIPSDEPQGDIEFVLDKVKGMRHKILDCREKRNNE